MLTVKLLVMWGPMKVGRSPASKGVWSKVPAWRGIPVQRGSGLEEVGGGGSTTIMTMTHTRLHKAARLARPKHFAA